MKKVAIFQSDLGVGGIQKSIINLLKNLDYSKLDVELYLSDNTEFWNIDFPGSLKIKYLKPINSIFKFMPFDIARKLAAPDFPACEEYDLAIDFNSYQFSCAAGATCIPAKRRVMWVHNNVEIKLGDEWKYRLLWFFFKGKFKYYDKFICVSNALVEPFKKMSKVSNKEFGVIQNYIDVSEIRRKSEEKPADFSVDENCMNFVALGRLCHQKGYDIMLDYFAKACLQRDDIRLYIIGGGPDEATLKELANNLGIADKVCFLGNQNNPFAYMNMMDAFISTSRYEGQPLNIMEAMAVGLPLYCSKNLEQYSEGLVGKEDMIEALVNAKKEAKHPDDLQSYNQQIIDSVVELANSMNL